ncbi:uncharacterized protein LOC125198870 [Salvia hispanica]|uniref:uncharacterized protein LOC125198024 n=1 Tax=Salvia hispanica TaxID=49212 RepID=UPI002009861F|nr:uncharacterized protein LOC125198024 [Salvia hispanica]XP_047953078.1 uncharacterized protein LOC125198870 [Salvia hispanica]
MGNAAPRCQPDAAGRVILSDGRVVTYDEPLTAAELMLEHPQHVVVEFKPIASGKKASPLPADQKLEIRKTYLMLRIRKGKPIQLSSEEARRLILGNNVGIKSSALLSCTGLVPLFARILPAIGGRRRLRGSSDERKEVEEEERLDCFAEILEGRPEFLSRQISGKGWKPSLDPIRENAVKPKVVNWVIL